MTRIAWVPSALLALVLASPGFAAPLYQVSAFVQAVSGGVVDTSTPGLSDSNPVSVSELRDVDDATGFGSAAAGPGSLAVFGTSHYTVTDATNDTTAAGDSTAISTIDDLIFSGTGPLFNLFLNLDLSGVMDVSGAPDLGLSVLAISFELNGQPAPSGIGGFRTVQIPSFFSDSGVLT